jgi:hypothetical protein
MHAMYINYDNGEISPPSGISLTVSSTGVVLPFIIRESAGFGGDGLLDALVSRLLSVGVAASPDVRLVGTWSILPSPSSSGIVAQYFLSTCFNAGLRIGFGRKWSIPLAIHSSSLLFSANAVNATIGAVKPISRISLVDWMPSRFGICTSMKIRLKGSILFSDGEGAMLSRTRLKASCPSLATVTSEDELAECCLCHANYLP